MNDRETLERLDTIISLLLPKFHDENYDFKGIKSEVMKLCDYSNTVQDMCKKLKKTRPQIDNALSFLRKHGYIRTITKGEDNVFLRLK